MSHILEDLECPICYGPFEDGDRIVVISSGEYDSYHGVTMDGFRNPPIYYHEKCYHEKIHSRETAKKESKQIRARVGIPFAQAIRAAVEKSGHYGIYQVFVNGKEIKNSREAPEHITRDMKIEIIFPKEKKEEEGPVRFAEIEGEL